MEPQAGQRPPGPQAGGRVQTWSPGNPARVGAPLGESQAVLGLLLLESPSRLPSGRGQWWGTGMGRMFPRDGWSEVRTPPAEPSSPTCPANRGCSWRADTRSPAWGTAPHPPQRGLLWRGRREAHALAAVSEMRLTASVPQGPLPGGLSPAGLRPPAFHAHRVQPQVGRGRGPRSGVPRVFPQPNPFQSGNHHPPITRTPRRAGI